MKMRALVKAQATTGLWMQEVPIPTIGANDVLIKITQTGICGTDLHIFAWDAWSSKTIKTPLVIGHEFCGVISQVGAEVKHLQVGDRVSGEAHITCGVCRNCRAGKRHLCPNTHSLGIQDPGAFAEYLRIPAENVYVLPANIPDQVAAILDPFGNAVHTALAFDLVGEDVLITGAGPIGVMTTAIAKYVGARNIVVTDINDYRLGLAKQLGATKVVNVSRESIGDVIKELGMVGGFDVGLEVSGNEAALSSMIQHMYPGGRIALLGLTSATPTPLDLHAIIFRELTVKGIYGREMFETWYKMVAMLQSGLDISPVITHHFQAADFAAAFQLAKSGKAGKVILDW